jgi:hypothetical protein
MEFDRTESRCCCHSIDRLRHPCAKEKHPVQYKRKKIWIDTFQTRLMIRVIAYCVLYQAMVWLLMAFSQRMFVFLEVLLQEPLPTGTWPPTIVVLVLLTPLLVLDALRFAHRLVGPLYRFRQTMKALVDGEPVQRIRLRKGDCLEDFRDEFNRLLDTLEAKGLVVLESPDQPAEHFPAPPADKVTIDG